MNSAVIPTTNTPARSAYRQGVILKKLSPDNWYSVKDINELVPFDVRHVVSRLWTRGFLKRKRLGYLHRFEFKMTEKGLAVGNN